MTGASLSVSGLNHEQAIKHTHPGHYDRGLEYDTSMATGAVSNMETLLTTLPFHSN